MCLENATEEGDSPVLIQSKRMTRTNWSPDFNWKWKFHLSGQGRKSFFESEQVLWRKGMKDVLEMRDNEILEISMSRLWILRNSEFLLHHEPTSYANSPRVESDGRTQGVGVSPKPSELASSRDKIFNWGWKARTGVCGKRLGRGEVRGEMPIELGDSWFSKKPVLAGSLLGNAFVLVDSLRTSWQWLNKTKEIKHSDLGR